MIKLRDISKSYLVDRRIVVPVLCNVSFVVNDHEFVIIAGHPGSGKTTLLNIMAGLTTPDQGEVSYDGVEVWKLPGSHQSLFRNRHIGFVFQFPSLMPSLTVLENTLLPTTFFATTDDAGERTRRAMTLLGVVGLDDKLGAYPRQLSLVQQQRLVIARALINEPRVLLADEPTAELDEPAEQEIMALLQDLHQGLGVTIVLATHSSDLIGYGTRGVHMASGQVVERLHAGDVLRLTIDVD